MADNKIDTSREPYFDDFDPEANHYQVLHRPSVAVQTRELNATQSILQDQITKFGRNIFKDGSVTEGCAFAFDNKYAFVKINDNYANGTAFTIGNFQDMRVKNANGLEAVIVNTVEGFQTQDPDTNTLYIKYINSATYTNGAQQSVFSNSEQLSIVTPLEVPIGNVVVLTPNALNSNSVATGLGYAFTTSSGVIFKNGYFINVEPQTIVVEKYDNFPDGLSVGFAAVESVETPEANTALYDNATGSPNFNAPGAHRFRIVPVLAVRETNSISNTDPFFSLCDFQSGKPVSINNDPQYNLLGAEMARRSYETNGDYVVSPFVLTTEPKSNNDPLFSTYNNIVASRGLAYVKGFRNEFINNTTVPIRKATNFANAVTNIITASFGSYVAVKDYAGDFNNAGLAQIELHSVVKRAVSNGQFLGVAYSSATVIGTAYLRGFSYSDGPIGTGGDEYSAYLFDIQMNAGRAFAEVKSIIYNSSGVKAVADVVQTFNAATNTNVTVLSQSIFNKTIFPFGQKALKQDGFNNQSYVYRKRSNTSFSNLISGTASVSVGAPIGSAVETFDFGGFLSTSAESSFIAIPTGGGTTTNKTGNVSVVANTTNVTGTSTSFLTDYTAGDYILINSETRQINSIANNTFLTITLPFQSPSAVANVHCKAFPQGVPIDFSKPNRSINIAANTSTFTLGEGLAGAFNVSIYYDILRSAAVPIAKRLKRRVYVAVNCASHAANTVGPWSLGLADVVKVNAVYVSTNGSFSNTVRNSAAVYSLDNGQRDDRYELASISTVSSNLTANCRVLVDLDVYTYDQSQGVGFFNANSYPVDDANTANTSAITTQEIPQYVATDGAVFDLRDCVDFRPFANNVASTVANSTNWATTATVNPNQNSTLSFYVNPSYGAFVPSPSANYTTDIEFYLPRKDKVVMKTSGHLAVVEGVPSMKPIAPIDTAGAMTLGIVNVPPYPSLSTQDAKTANRYDYAMAITITQNKRFTMKDIGTLSNKIDQLEYYTSLNLLEQSAAATLVRSSTTGQNRFQNGMLADPFAGSDIADTFDPTYNICIDASNTEMRPAILSFVKAVWTNDDDLPFDTDEYIFQNHTSAAINCSASFYTYKGRIEFEGTLPCPTDYYNSPDVCNDLARNSQFCNIPCRPPKHDVQDCRTPHSCTWGFWRRYDVDDRCKPDPKDCLSDGQTDKYGNVCDDLRSRCVPPVCAGSPSLPAQFGSRIDCDNNTGSYTDDCGVLTNTCVVDYVCGQDIAFIARGLKPNTALHAFSDCYDVTFYVRPCEKGFDEKHMKWFGDPIVSDDHGYVYGMFRIPRGIFKKGQIVLTLADVTDIVLDVDKITTRADGRVGTKYCDQEHECDEDLDYCDYQDECDIHVTVIPESIVTPGGVVVTRTCRPAPFRDEDDEFDRLSDDDFYTKWQSDDSDHRTWDIPRRDPGDCTDDDDWDCDECEEGFRDCCRRTCPPKCTPCAPCPPPPPPPSSEGRFDRGDGDDAGSADSDSDSGDSGDGGDGGDGGGDGG